MMLRNPFHRPAAVDLPRPATPANPSHAAGSGLPHGVVSGLALRLAANSAAARLTPHPAPAAEKKA